MGAPDFDVSLAVADVFIFVKLKYNELTKVY